MNYLTLNKKSSRRRETIAARTRRLRPAVMALEGRTLLSTIIVNSLKDDDSAGTLRSAIGQADASNQADTIVFSGLFDSPQTITLTGGALALTGTETTTITGPGANFLTVSGGGTSGVFVIDGASAAISGLTVSDGSAAVGGGVRNDGGTLTLSDVTVRGNTATDRGGGIATRFSTASTTLVDCLVSGNTAVNEGGGVLNQGATLTVTNATVTGNTATTGSGGGLASDDGTTTLLNATVTGNTAGSGGGLSVVDVSANVTNTIVAANTGGDASGIINGGNNVIGGDPKLGPLGDYGGPTLTMPPLPGSPAIGAGTSDGAPATDQRGQTRGDRIDAGAFESQVIIPVNTVLDGVGSAPGQISLRQAVNIANVLTSEDAIVFTSLFTTPQTITLTNGPLVLTDKATTTIAGPGANLLTVSGGGQSRVFDIAGGSVAMQDLTIADGSADNGGGLQNNGGTLVMTDAVVSGNRATGSGGGLQNAAGSATLNSVTFGNNSASDGGGLANAATLSMTGGMVTGNTAGSSGGGLWDRSGTSTLTNTTVSGNTALGNGGGLYSLTSTLNLSGCTLSGNKATGPGARGGGLFTRAVENYPLNVTTMTNCTLTGNSCPDYGGALYQSQYSSATLTNVTVVGNSAGFSAGGIWVTEGTTMTLINSIVAVNTGGDISASAGELLGSNNVVGVDPELAPLFDYGGPTMTMPPLPGSPALGAGNANGAPATDQRGLPRSGPIDIGAFQTEPGLIVNTPSDGVTSDPGTLNLRDAINLANALPTADTITFSSLFSTPQTIELIPRQQLELTDKATTTIDGPGAGLLTIKGGGNSRVFYLDGASAVMSDVTISGGATAAGGSGLYMTGGTLALTDVTISGNTTSANGGGLLDRGGILNMTGCTVSGNYAALFGGGLEESDSTVKLSGCTVSGNSVSANGDGGGFNLNGGTTNMTNVTISGNTARYGGGGIGNYASVELLNVTIAGNVGAGVFNVNSPLVAYNTIIDNYLGTNVGGSNNWINADPVLAPLGDYGGPTATMPELPGSPAIGAGTTTNAPATDQRGVVRPKGAAPDIGAFQSEGFTMVAVQRSNPQSTPTNQGFPNPLAVIVTANNPVEPVNGGVITYSVTPVGGASAALSATTVTITNGQASVTATANGTRGTYLVTAAANGAGAVGFALNNTEAPSLLVTTTLDVVNADDGLTSLREAIAYANSHPGPDTIELTPGVLGSRKLTIRLTGGPLVLTDPATTTIVGPGAKRLTISGAGRSRVFDVEGGSLALKGMTIRGGRAARGGGIRNDHGTLALDHIVLRDNSARVGGGLFNNGTTTLTHVIIGNNSARTGAGLFSTRTATLSRRRRSSPAPTG